MNEIIDQIDKTLALSPQIQSLRQAGRDAFARLGLPAAKAEEYRHTPLTRLLQKNLRLDRQSTTVTDLKPKDLGITGLDTDVLVFINGAFATEFSSIRLTSKIEVSSLADALEKGDKTAIDHVGKYVDFSEDGLAAWNTAAWSNGAYIRVADNFIVERPVLIYHWNDARTTEAVSLTRNLIVVGKSSEVTVIEQFMSTGSHNHFSNNITEVVVKENAGFNHYIIQADSGNAYQYNLTKIHQERSSRANTYTMTLDGKLIRNNLQLTLDGEGIESHMFGLYLVSGDTIADNHTVVDHRKPNSFSNEIYKGIMDGNAKGVFNGKIYVRPQAQKTNAFQANRNILLSDGATVNTKPQLEIWADDVKCSHGCTTGQLDEEAIFYLQSRGIDKETCRAMMLYAFAAEILDNVKNAELKTYFEGLVGERLQKKF
ncbi:MAG: Fe-S cluster assembly protein SufD [Chryseolinea sp.]